MLARRGWVHGLWPTTSLPASCCPSCKPLDMKFNLRLRCEALPMAKRRLVRMVSQRFTVILPFHIYQKLVGTQQISLKPFRS